MRHIQRRAGYQRTTIGAHRVLNGVKIGDSIALDGACHTVVAFDTGHFVVESVEETLRRTVLGQWTTGSRVNLERSLKLGDRLDGHMVAGHVDGVGKILNRRESTDNVLFELEMPEDLSPYVAEKGSVAINGISLTVVSAMDRAFSVAIIPHTLSATTLSEKRPGAPVNLEVDLIARYIERLMRFGRTPSAHGLTEAAILKMGYAQRG